MNDFEQCIKERHLLTIKASKEMIEKEITSAEYDLSRSKESIQDEDYKWASVQAYYSMFHAAKALVLKKRVSGEKPLLFDRRYSRIVCERRYNE